ncbi:hypothetical protein DVH24_032345 [Malus domestica]|uniref:Uncharacterized protein n=1 Tax=Malus domestica TaxID=3750 RepID=A0A498J341_MALDO|nr:hypothetical protein DVH24_032345 [Malus domestica]
MEELFYHHEHNELLKSVQEWIKETAESCSTVAVLVATMDFAIAYAILRLNDKNFSKWVYQFKSVMKGYKMFDHFDGTTGCPPKFVINTEHGVTSSAAIVLLVCEHNRYQYKGIPSVQSRRHSQPLSPANGG